MYYTYVLQSEKDNGFYVGFVGTLYDYQGIDCLIDSAPLILDKIPNVKFLIVGEGMMRMICVVPK